jgi:hypothetical protein
MAALATNTAEKLTIITIKNTNYYLAKKQQTKVF